MAYSFSSGNYFRHDTSPTLPSTGTLTLSMWIYRTGSDPGTGYYALALNDSVGATEPSYVFYAGWASQMTSTRDLSVDNSEGGFTGSASATWEHWLFEISTTAQPTAELDGSAATRAFEWPPGGPSGSQVGTTDEIYIGEATGGGEPWSGRLAHITIWDGTLTSTQKSNLASGDNPVAVESGGTATILRYYPLTSTTEWVTGDTITTIGSPSTAAGPTVDPIPGPAAVLHHYRRRIAA